MGLPSLNLIQIVTGVAIGVITPAIIWTWKYILKRRHAFEERLKEDRYTAADGKRRVIENRDPYVRPDCQDNSPADPDPATDRRPIFEDVDRLLDPPLIGRFTLILADTGMGKSTFLERYYKYCWRSPKRIRHFKPSLIPLNELDADELLNRLDSQARGETVLLLDALDEDNSAIADFDVRFNQIVELAGKVRAVVITCRTQFAGVAHIPGEVKLPPIPGPMPLSGGPDGKIRRLYLSPFSDWQVRRYLVARFPLWRSWRNPILLVRGLRAARRFRDLISRPLLLTYIQDLASSPVVPKYSIQAYTIIVNRWLDREVKDKQQLTSRPEDLLAFSEELAVSLFTSGRDRIPAAELQSLTEQFRVKLVPREVRERSLLHNDANDNWKFHYRSFMEYLFVRAASKAENRPLWAGQPWTDQMRVFAREMLLSGECKRLPWADLSGMDLKGADLSGINLEGADLSDKNLTEARRAGANLDSANLRGACLDRADVSSLSLGKARGLTLLQAIASSAHGSTEWPVDFLIGHAHVGGHKVVGHHLALNADGRLAVCLSEDNTLQVWEVATRCELRILQGHTGAIQDVALSGDGRLAISASEDKTLKVWEVASGRQLHTLQGHQKGVLGVALSANGRTAVSGSYDKTLKVWEVPSGRELRTLQGHAHWVCGVAVDRDGRIAVSGSGLL